MRDSRKAGWSGAIQAMTLVLCSSVLCADDPNAPSESQAPSWMKRGGYVFRVSTPDEANVLPQLAEGHRIVANLLDGTVPQYSIVNGLIGHDHSGPWNWDGLWPYWNRTTFRAGNFEQLAEFMRQVKEESNVTTGFHLNLTDVNIGLRDYPESRDFFRKLVQTRCIYRRDWNQNTSRRDGAPYVPSEIDQYSEKAGEFNPVQIFALVNYKQFWDSGLARAMIDEFYGHLPHPPAVLYLDVLNAGGGNFSTGLPDGALGGSEPSQIEGMQAIADYLHSKGTDVGTEGNRHFLGEDEDGHPRAGYVWLHGDGFSSDDYRIISGGSGVRLVGHHVFGNPGAFNVSPIAVTRPGLERVHEHYRALLAGKPGTRQVAGAETSHIAIRYGSDEFDIPGTGDAFRGDWIDLVNNFYLTTIQELYHIGKGNTRQRSDSIGHVHLGAYTVSGNGESITVSVPDFAEPDWARAGAQKAGRLMIERPTATRVSVARGGDYQLRARCFLGGRSSNPQIGIYVNGQHYRTFEQIPISEGAEGYELDAGMVRLKAGENTITFDSGFVRASWSDGTMAEWTTPALNRGFRAWNGDVVFADDYDRMWPDTWSGQQKIYFFSWDGTTRDWKLPADWSSVQQATLYPLTPQGRGQGVRLEMGTQTAAPHLLPQVPYVLIPDVQ